MTSHGVLPLPGRRSAWPISPIRKGHLTRRCREGLLPRPGFREIRSAGVAAHGFVARATGHGVVKGKTSEYRVVPNTATVLSARAPVRAAEPCKMYAIGIAKRANCKRPHPS